MASAVHTEHAAAGETWGGGVRLALHLLRRTSSSTANRAAVQRVKKKEEREEGGDGETSLFPCCVF